MRPLLQPRHRSMLVFLAGLAIFTIGVTIAAQFGLVSTSFVKTLGKTLCLCLAALAMDLIWGYAGILSLGHMAFFALGGYMIGMWLMYARTEEIVIASLMNSGLRGGAAGHCDPDFRRGRRVRPARDLGLCP